MKLLLIEDERTLSRLIVKGLQKSGYAIDTAFDGEEALELFDINIYDLIILDLNIPKIDGIDVLKHIRQVDENMCVLILSARSDIDDVVVGLDNGANDYVTKPFDFQVLEARIRSLLRRSFTQKNTVMSAADLKINTAQKIGFVHNKPIDLTKKEYAILEYFLFNKNRVISAEELMEHVWNSDVDLLSNTLKFHIHSLRKKIAKELGEVEAIKTVRGQGYIIQDHEVNQV
ncbi:response regulator transcription factor [Sporosarcina sp. ANT_H38]|uniref:response regulator transcription factor n=1 Tax=Sporosarcina sp. ANT_H38 TaxID=2597358 RepID=UPI0011F1A715|nr:response regulator transcription factor [Sporosarcina sp. ANT_H38]KAA0941036.1 response regulator transcription factor [Sporosarcina sp. ANT_H38]